MSVGTIKIKDQLAKYISALREGGGSNAYYCLYIANLNHLLHVIFHFCLQNFLKV